MVDLTGPDQARAMLRRVSPEGRAQALKEQRRRQERSARIAIKVLALLVAVVAAAGGYALASGGLDLTALAIALVVFAAGCFLLGRITRPASISSSALAQTQLAALPDASAQWLERQALALPAPAARAAEAIAGDIGVLGPQIAQLAPQSPAAEAVRRLLAVELPALVEHYRAVPEPLRARPLEGGASADQHLLGGLAIVREEVGRMSEQLARGELDALAVQDRFLELKYQGEAMLLPSPSA